jgi:hypothetical protein
MDIDISRAGTEPLLVKFYRQYMQQIYDVTYPPGTLLVNPDVQDILFKYFFDSSQNKYLPPARFQARILKHIISEIEKSCKDPEEDVGLARKLTRPFETSALPPSCEVPSSIHCRQVHH